MLSWSKVVRCKAHGARYGALTACRLKVTQHRLKNKGTDGNPHPLVPFLAKGEGNLTLSLCDIPLLAKGEERFGKRQNRVRWWMLHFIQHDEVNSKPHPVCFADIPLLAKGGERFGERQNRVRSIQRGCFASLSMTR